MNLNLLYFFSCFVCATPALGDMSYLPITGNLRLPEPSEVIDCSIGSIHLSVKNQHILIATNKSKLSVGLDEIPDDGELIVGDMTGNGFCDLAVPYGKSDVNETYTLLLHDPSQEKLTRSKVGVITNPAVKIKRIISSYRDAARWSKEILCYSEDQKDFFVCEKRTDIN